MDTELRARGYMLLLLIGLVGLLGIILLSVMMMLRKRMLQARDEERATGDETSEVDAWTLSGKRLTGDEPLPGQELELGLDDLDDDIDAEVLGGGEGGYDDEHDFNDEAPDDYQDFEDDDDEDSDDEGPNVDRFPFK